MLDKEQNKLLAIRDAMATEVRIIVSLSLSPVPLGSECSVHSNASVQCVVSMRLCFFMRLDKWRMQMSGPRCMLHGVIWRLLRLEREGF